MININTTKAKQFLSDSEFENALEKATESFKKVQNKSGVGSDWLGWRNMLEDPNDALLEEIDSLGTSIHEKADVFIICGIGGSYLGSRAVIDALTPFFGNDGPEILYAGNQMSGQYLEELIEHLEEPAADGSAKSVYLNVISKSGTTLETALSFRILRDWMKGRFENDLQERIICTTSSEGGALNKLIDEYKFKKFIIPDDVGGRFSVLTPVGLLPIAAAGIDIKTLFYEAVYTFEELEENPGMALDYAATKYALYEKNKTLDVITSFEPQLSSLGGWLQQLFGESEGKEEKGMFPVVASYSTDLHSLGQFMQQGSRNMMETFIKVEQSPDEITVNKMDSNHDGLDYLAGRTFHEINAKALEGTLQAHVEGGVPSVVVSLERLNVTSIGAFIYTYELATAIYCYCLGVNPFNQPGVEDYKKAMYKLLGKK